MESPHHTQLQSTLTSTQAQTHTRTAARPCQRKMGPLAALDHSLASPSSRWRQARFPIRFTFVLHVMCVVWAPVVESEKGPNWGKSEKERREMWQTLSFVSLPVCVCVRVSVCVRVFALHLSLCRSPLPPPPPPFPAVAHALKGGEEGREGASGKRPKKTQKRTSLKTQRRTRTRTQHMGEHRNTTNAKKGGEKAS